MFGKILEKISGGKYQVVEKSTHHSPLGRRPRDPNVISFIHIQLVHRRGHFQILMIYTSKRISANPTTLLITVVHADLIYA